MPPMIAPMARVESDGTVAKAATSAVGPATASTTKPCSGHIRSKYVRDLVRIGGDCPELDS